MRSPKPIKVLIAEDDGRLAHQTRKHLTSCGFEVRVAHSGSQAKSLITDWQPRFVLADLILQEMNAFEMIEFIRSHHLENSVQVLVLSGHSSTANVQAAFKKGAMDYIVKPFDLNALAHRLYFHCQESKEVKDLTPAEMNQTSSGAQMLFLTDLLLRQALQPQPLQNRLFNLCRMVSSKLGAVRCSIIHCLDQHRGLVVSSNDDFKATGIELKLERYPEILNVLNSQKVLVVENLDSNQQLRGIKSLLEQIQFNSMIVCPVQWGGQVQAVLSLRMPEEQKHISDDEVRFAEVVSHIVSLSLNSEYQSSNQNFWNSAA